MPHQNKVKASIINCTWQNKPPHINCWLSHLLILMIGICSLILTGCADMVEIQERDFVQAIGISYHNQFQITYALPNLDTLTGQSTPENHSGFIRKVEGKSFPEIEESYNLNSNHRLDYRHLQVIILDQSIASKPDKLKELLIFINDSYDLSHNVLVFYFPGDAQDLMVSNGELDGSIGEYLKNLNKNNQRNGVESVKIGSLIDCLNNNRTLLIPTITSAEHSLTVEGSALFQNNQIKKQLSQPQNDLYYILEGQGSDYLFTCSDNTIIRLKDLKSKSHYQWYNDKPLIQFVITGSAQLLPTSAKTDNETVTKIDQDIQNQLESELLEHVIQDQLDYLNLYENSSFKSRSIWMSYQNNETAFLNDLMLEVAVDFSLE